MSCRMSSVFPGSSYLLRYARAFIPEVWIVANQRQIIEQYTQPFEDQYMRLHK